MAVFTAVGAYVAGTIFGLVGTAAVVVGAIVSTAAAYITSRVINGNPNKGNNSSAGGGSQGGRIQIPPATNNKIPVVYGNAYVNGIITDARLVNENKTMYYCIVLSETCNNAAAVYNLNNVYWNDLRLEAVDNGANAHKVKDGRKKVDGPGEDFIDTNFIVDGKSLVELRVYAGSSAAASQIYPAQSSGNTQAAYDFWGADDNSWTTAYQMKGLVFAIVKITYNGEKGFTALPNVTFQLDNSINNPADVWFDYMTSSRYGADINPSYIDQTPTTSALAKWRAYSDELITYTPVGGGSSTQKRYTMNGVIDTNRSVKENIDIICQNGGAWLSYNVNTGLWQPIPKRAATAPELSSALQFSDDNIITGISISSTRLEDLYNSFEAEFFDKYNKDQKAYARLSLPDIQRNPNEPDNQLRLSLDFVNNSVQAELLGQIELRQSRDDLVIEFTSNDYGIQAQAGDVIGVSTELYDWAPKYFRVMRVKEIETDEGGLVANIQALEYNADVYSVEPITEFTTSANIGIGVFGASPNLPEPPVVVITEVDADVPVPFFQMQVQIPTTGGPYDEMELFITEGWDPIDITGSIVPGTGSNGAPVGKGLMTVTGFAPATPYGVINSGDYFDLGGTIVESQITNTPASKTFVSGGAVGTNTVTLNDVTGLLVGNNLIGTGLSAAGSHILVIGPGNQVTMDEFFTAQATGTYNVEGGLGTYIVSSSITTSGTDTLYDLPIDADFKYLRRQTPAGNTPTFTNGETISIVISDLPANSQTYRRWFIKARMGVKNLYGKFSQPGIVNNDGNFRYTPNPVGGGGGPGGGSNPLAAVFSSVDIVNTTPFLTFSEQPDGVNPMYGIRGESALTDPWFVGAGSTGIDSGYLELATGDNAGDPSDKASPIYARQYNGYASGGVPWVTGGAGVVVNSLTLLDENGHTVVPNNLTVNSGVLFVDSVNNRVGVNRISPQFALDVNGNTNITGNATVSLDLAVNGGGPGNTADITSTASQANIFNAGVPDINIGNDSVTTRIGKNDAASQVLIKPATLVGERDTQNLFNTVATTVNAFGAATAVNIGAATGVTTINHDLTVQGGNINLNGVATAGQQPFLTFATQPDGVNSQYGIRGYSTVDDPWFIGAGSTGDDAGYLEIATGDNIGGTNNGGQIYVRQYNGAAPLTSVPWFGGNGTIVNELILLDNLGHTVIPNNLTVDTNTLFVDSATNRVGIKTLTPSVELTVIGDTSLSNNLNVNGNVLFVNADTDRVGINTGAPDRTLHVVGTSRITGDAIFGSNVEIQGQNLTTTQTTFNLLNTTATTVNAFGAATIVNMGSAAGIVNFANNIKVTGVINPFDDLVIGKNLIITENLRINGNQIKDSANVTRIQFNPPSQPATVLLDANATVTGDLRLNGNVIRASDGELRITFDEPSPLINRTVINGRAEVTENLNVVGVLTAGTLNLGTTTLDVGSVITDALDVGGDGTNPALIRALRIENKFRLNNIDHTAALSSGSVIDPKLAPVVRFVNTTSTAFTLAVGVEEQTFIMMNTTTAVNTFTVTNAGWKSSGSGTLVLNSIGSTANMTYQGGKWYVIGSYDATLS